MADRTERMGSQVIHVRENSDHALEALFSAALQDSPGNIPLRMRNLPASFFKPPEPQISQNHHSREGSTDSTGYVNSAPNGSIQTIHTRAHSSPAQLQGPLTTLSPPQHARQHSCDLLDEQPLPHGWEMAKTPEGQRYFLNHMMQITTWHDPRKPNFNVANSSSIISQSSPQPSHQHSPNVSLQNIQNLQQSIPPIPAGWEQAQTPEGEIYYINHIERSTSWFDPRLPMNMQRLQVRSPPQPQPSQVPVQPAVHSTAQPAPMPAAPPQQQPPPPPQQQGLQQPSPHQQQSALQKLQMEKELLRKRQEELNRQEMALRNPAVSRPVTSTTDTSSEMTTVTDPFLGQSNAPNDLHARSESGDSGLGGMGSGTNFLSRTPEEFLSNVSEMDAQDGGHRQGDFNNMDMSNIDGTEHTNMDSDDLVPSLQEDISNELLNDVESVLSYKMDNNMDSPLTWL